MTKADETPFTGNTVLAVFNVTSDDPSTNMLTRLGSKETVGPHDGFEFAYFYTPPISGLEYSFGNANGIPGSLWNGMKVPVDILLAPPMVDLGGPNYYVSGFNYYDFNNSPGGNPHDGGSIWGYPGYLALQNDVDLLLADLTDVNTHVKNVYISGHGNFSVMGTADKYNPNLSIEATDISDRLGNQDYFTGYNVFLSVSNPFRFVFLDGCRTGISHWWSDAFGIFPLVVNSRAPRNVLGPQAFVGWGRDATAWTGGLYNPSGSRDDDKSEKLAWSYSKTLADFYTEWQAGNDSLATCIYNASIADQRGQAPLSVPPRRKFICFSIFDGPNGTPFYPGFKCSVAYPAKIYITGHSGLTRYGYLQEYDGEYSPPW